MYIYIVIIIIQVYVYILYIYIYMCHWENDDVTRKCMDYIEIYSP